MIAQISRKFSQVLSKIKKVILKSDENQPIVLINSFPKSGTHLLHQIISIFPYVEDHKTFIVSMPSFTQRVRTNQEIIKKYEKQVIPGELIRGHQFHSPELASYLSERRVVQYFIYRDPRDVVISEANYLYDMNRIHKLHKYFRKFKALEDRIMFSIMGNTYHSTPIDYLDINGRFQKYIGWLKESEVYSVRYEDLVADQRQAVVEKIVMNFCNKCNYEVDLTSTVTAALKNINPQKSHTFRSGGTEKWKKYFTPEHKAEFKERAGQLLIDLGYEKDMDW
ncbi:MAG: sulfotransferase domain-containing protein [Candidatus Marinimicrobia bacterium]|nr:sulfotransferase domain-containing protein [Candidatus Neomarinimicrobiota bacterium]MCF7850185.1 sulfotransferase domain-containing protein [Candidatus Neomarinimicrobiota bacterium]